MAAQQNGSTVEVAAGVLVDRDATFNTPAGQTVGWLVAVRRNVTRRLGIAAELEVPRSTRVTETAAYPGGVSQADYRHRSVTLGLAADVGGRLGERARLSACVGVAPAWRQSEARFRVEIRDTVIEDGSRTLHYATLAMAGGDVALDVMTHVTVGAGVRVFVAPLNDFGWTIVRPRLTVRWEF